MSDKSIGFQEFVRLLGTLDSADLGFMHRFSKALAKRDPRDELLLARLRSVDRAAYPTRREWQLALLAIVQRAAFAAERQRSRTRQQLVRAARR